MKSDSYTDFLDGDRWLACRVVGRLEFERCGRHHRQSKGWEEAAARSAERQDMCRAHHGTYLADGRTERTRLWSASWPVIRLHNFNCL